MIAEKKSLKENIIKILSSPYLAGLLFILLAAIIFIGTNIPQEPMVGKSALIEKFGEKKYLFLNSLLITDIFHSWWFVALFAFLGTNLILASFTKVFPRAKKAFVWPVFIKEIKEPEINLQNTSIENLFKSLNKKGWRVKLSESKNSLVAIKGAFHRLGPSITHIGILTILFGAILSLLFGFNGVVQGTPGDRFIISNVDDSKRSYILTETSKIFHSPIWIGQSPEFEIEILSTKRLDHSTGQPKQWISDILFLNNNGKTLAKQSLSVNNPINFKGIDFYQADWKRVLRIVFNRQNVELPLNKMKRSEASIITVTPELALIFWLFPDRNEKLFVFSLKGKVDRGIVEDPQSLLSKGLITPLFNLNPGDQSSIGPMQIKLIGAFSKTGIQYKYSPSDYWMILGMVILLFGVFISFGAKRTLWGVLKNGELRLIGNADRHKEAFKEELEDLKIYLNKSVAIL